MGELGGAAPSRLSHSVAGYKPFQAADPLCRLNLLETSDFVRALPNSNSNGNGNGNGNGKKKYSTDNGSAERRSRDGGGAARPRAELAPRTPARAALGSLARRPAPSKWDDADKWLISSSGSSCRASPAHAARPDKPRRPLAPPPPVVPPQGGSPPEDTLKDKLTEMVEAATQRRRDAATEMTPLGSSTGSRCPTPFKASSPARHNTPADRSGPIPAAPPKSGADLSEIKDGHFASLVFGGSLFDSNWSSREEEEEELSKSLRHFAAAGAGCGGASESPSAAWEDDAKAKICVRYQREEAKIQAWVNLQNAKAEAESRKLEVKIQKMRSRVEEKLMRKMAVVSRKAEEWRAAAQQQHAQDMVKAAEQAQKMKALHGHGGRASLGGPRTACGCIPLHPPHYIAHRL
ncbi:remorin family protein [Wolffia australiana]